MRNTVYQLQLNKLFYKVLPPCVSFWQKRAPLMPFFIDRMLSQATSHPGELSPSSQAKHCPSSVFSVRIQTLHVGTRRFFIQAKTCTLFCVDECKERMFFWCGCPAVAFEPRYVQSFYMYAESQWRCDDEYASTVLKASR